MKQVKLVVVGDDTVGKTCLSLSYTNNRFPTEYIPTKIFDIPVVQLTVGDETIELGLWDTAAQEEYERMRSLSYFNTKIFLLCFSVVDPVSFQNIKSNGILKSDIIAQTHPSFWLAPSPI